MTSSPDDYHHHSKKKRVGKACDLCRIKKTKCDGKKPCSRCIADNKLCAFTNKTKHKEKSHPNGYIDLLETRLDLVTKSFERIVLLAEPHLPFLHELMARARAEHALISSPDSEALEQRDEHYVPINEVVSYLISDMGLLDKEPLEWEQGARIAAKLSPLNVVEALREFTKHKLDVANGRAHSPKPNYVSPPLSMPRHSRSSSTDSIESPALLQANSITEQLNLDDISLGGFSTTQSEMLPAQLLESFSLDGFPKRANSLFINNNEIASLLLLVSSLANRLESHDLEESLRCRRLSSLKGPLSPSHQKLKLNGHIHKPGLTHVHHAVQNNFISNNGNEFHLPKAFSSAPSTQSLPDIVSTALSKNLVFSQAMMDDDLGFEDLSSHYDTADFKPSTLTDREDLFGNNPFLSSFQ